MNNRAENLISLYWQSGDASASPLAFLESLKQQGEAPLLSWIEPLPSVPPVGELGPRRDLQELMPGWPLLSGIEAEEIRLYWPAGMLQIILTESGCRWFACSEQATGLPLPQLHWQHPPVEEEQVRSKTYSVYLRQDWRRFRGDVAIESDVSPAKIKIVEYRQQARLFTWRLLPDERSSRYA